MLLLRSRALFGTLFGRGAENPLYPSLPFVSIRGHAQAAASTCLHPHSPAPYVVTIASLPAQRHRFVREPPQWLVSVLAALCAACGSAVYGGPRPQARGLSIY